MNYAFFLAPTIISMAEWGAKKPQGPVNPLEENPPPYVIVHHSASDTCTTRAICQAKVRAFQVRVTNFNNRDINNCKNCFPRFLTYRITT